MLQDPYIPQDLYIPQHPYIIELPTLDALAGRSRAIGATMGGRGFCIIRGLPNDGDTILALARHFGDIQRHIRADSRGVVGDTPQDVSWRNYLPEYHGVSAEEFAPHTDGSFVDGMLVEGDKVRRITSPRLLLLQIAQRAEQGGDNTVADGGAILDYLTSEEPEAARLLATSGCITISRDDQMALAGAVFERVRRGVLKIRFRYDDKVYTPSWARDAVTRFHHLTLDPRFSNEISADQGDIIVLDNWRVLHGRKMFKDNSTESRRNFRRLWISDDDTEDLVNLVDRPHLNRSQEVYRHYATIPSPVPVGQRIRFPCGIALSPQRAASLS